MNNLNLSSSANKTLKLQSSITLGNETNLVQEQYINEKFVLNCINEKKILFLPEPNKLFIVDDKNQLLRLFDNYTTEARTQKFREFVGEINSTDIIDKNINGFICKGKKFKNKENNTIKIVFEVYYTTIEGLEDTAMESFRKIEQRISLVPQFLKSNEIIAHMSTIIIDQGNIQRQCIEVTDVEYSDNFHFEDFSNFKISNPN